MCVDCVTRSCKWKLKNNNNFINRRATVATAQHRARLASQQNIARPIRRHINKHNMYGREFARIAKTNKKQKTKKNSNKNKSNCREYNIIMVKYRQCRRPLSSLSIPLLLFSFIVVCFLLRFFSLCRRFDSMCIIAQRRIIIVQALNRLPLYFVYMNVPFQGYAYGARVVYWQLLAITIKLWLSERASANGALLPYILL